MEGGGREPSLKAVGSTAFAGGWRSMSICSFMPSFPELWSAEGQVVSSLCTISVECIWEREASECPPRCFLQGFSIFLGTLEARNHKHCAGAMGLLSKVRGSAFWGVFRALLISKDLQTGQSNVSHRVTVGAVWEEARLLKVSPASSWVLLPPWAAATVPWKPFSQAAWAVVWDGSNTAENDLGDLRTPSFFYLLVVATLLSHGVLLKGVPLKALWS